MKSSFMHSVSGFGRADASGDASGQCRSEVPTSFSPQNLARCLASLRNIGTNVAKRLGWIDMEHNWMHALAS